MPPVNLEAGIRCNFAESVRTTQQALERIAPAIARAALSLWQAYTRGDKVLCCGNGGSASDAQHFSSEMLNHYAMDRPGLPAITLSVQDAAVTSIANDYGYDEIFSRQILALGNAGDILLAISTSGNSANILAACRAAHSRGMQLILLSGRDGGRAAELLRDGDIGICVPGPSTARIQEVHILVIHCLCDLVDSLLSGKET
jgi:D-sedoheptulose 7-phosphate isomerase